MGHYFSRREFCRRISWSAAAAAIGNFSAAGSGREATSARDPEAMEFLKGIAEANIKAAHVPPRAFKIGGGFNTTGITLITPGGSYPAFWIRDYAMSLDCGLIGPDEMLKASPRFRRLCIDRHGIGMNLAENLRTEFRSRVEGIALVGQVKETLAVDLKIAFPARAAAQQAGRTRPWQYPGPENSPRKSTRSTCLPRRTTAQAGKTATEAGYARFDTDLPAKGLAQAGKNERHHADRKEPSPQRNGTLCCCSGLPRAGCSCCCSNCRRAKRDTFIDRPPKTRIRTLS